MVTCQKYGQRYRSFSLQQSVSSKHQTGFTLAVPYLPLDSLQEIIGTFMDPIDRLLFYHSILYLLYFYPFKLYDTPINSNHHLHLFHPCLGRGVYCGVICLAA